MGKISNLTVAYFSNGLVQPPTRSKQLRKLDFDVGLDRFDPMFVFHLSNCELCSV